MMDSVVPQLQSGVTDQSTQADATKSLELHLFGQ